jgi:hypothetical protein
LGEFVFCLEPPKRSHVDNSDTVRGGSNAGE